ncbi:hypothetical protein, partial [Leptospira interrogans]|uniref:hypothetical protein n=1 Tax=Leptospira interrogans TaxID=173 RepID=UPI000B181BE6
PKLRRIFSSSFHSQLLPLFLEKKVSTFMLLGQSSHIHFLWKNQVFIKTSLRRTHAIFTITERDYKIQK